VLPASARPGGSESAITAQLTAPTPVAVSVALYGRPMCASASWGGDVMSRPFTRSCSVWSVLRPALSVSRRSNAYVPNAPGGPLSRPSWVGPLTTMPPVTVQPIVHVTVSKVIPGGSADGGDASVHVYGCPLPPDGASVTGPYATPLTASGRLGFRIAG